MIYKFFIKSTLCLLFILTFPIFSSESEELIKYIADRHIHSTHYDYLAYENAKKMIVRHKLKMTCGSICHFAERYLREKGIQCRFILTLTLEEWNDYNNGHSMIEVFEDGKWKLWDIDQKCYFCLYGEHLDAKTFCELSKYPFEIVSFSDEPVIPVEDSETWFGKLISTEEGKRWFYARSCQIPMIRENNIFYFTCDEKYRERIEDYPRCGPFQYLTKDQFERMFYP